MGTFLGSSSIRTLLALTGLFIFSKVGMNPGETKEEIKVIWRLESYQMARVRSDQYSQVHKESACSWVYARTYTQACMHTYPHTYTRTSKAWETFHFECLLRPRRLEFCRCQNRLEGPKNKVIRIWFFFNGKHVFSGLCEGGKCVPNFKPSP